MSTLQFERAERLQRAEVFLINVKFTNKTLKVVFFLKLISRTYLISFSPIFLNHLSKDSRKARPKTARLRDLRRLCGGERSSQNDSRQWVHSRCTCNLHWYNRGGISCQNPFARKFYSDAVVIGFIPFRSHKPRFKRRTRIIERRVVKRFIRLRRWIHSAEKSRYIKDRYSISGS